MINHETRRNLIILVCVLVLWAVIALAFGGINAGAQSGPVGKHLFIDDAMIDKAHSSGWMLRVNPPTVLKRVITANKDWENFGFYWYQLQVFDLGDKRFENSRYVMAYPAWSRDSAGQSAVNEAVAVSSDGVNWRKPFDIDGTRYEGQPSNLVSKISVGDMQHGQSWDSVTGLWYRTTDDDSGRLAITSSSADGLNWATLAPPVYLTAAPYGVDGTRNFIRTDDDKYLWFLRGWPGGVRAVMLSRSDRFDRLQWSNVSNPDLHWPLGDPPQYAITDEVPTLAKADAADWAGWDGGKANSVQIYRWLPFRYGDVYVAYPWLYHLLSATTERKGVGQNDGEYDSELAVSRDGVQWTRYRTPTYFPRDSGLLAGMYMTLSANQPLVIGDKIYDYILALPYTKRSAWLNGQWANYRATPANEQAFMAMDKGGVYVTEQRFDGFVALQATGTSAAVVTTQGMVPAGGTLTVNHTGPVLVEVLDGTTVISSRSLTGDNLRTVAATVLPSKPLRVRFTIPPEGRVFAFEFVPGQMTSTPTPTATAKPTNTPTRTPTSVPSAPTSTPMPPVNLLDSVVFRFESAAIAIPDGYRIDVTVPDTSACWHYDVPGNLAGRQVTFGGELWRSADMGGYAPYLSIQVLRAQARAYNVGGTLRHTAAPGTWQDVSKAIDIPADAQRVRASFCVWRAQPGTARARDMRLSQ